MLELILGRARSGKTARVMSKIAGDVREKRPGSIMIVPEQYSHEAERELCSACGDELSLYAEVLSFTRLASRVADTYGGSARKNLDKGGKLLCMALAVDDVWSSLTVYSDAKRRPELQKSLLDAIEELKSACIGVEELQRAVPGGGKALGHKLEDISLVMAAYDAAVIRSGADPTDRLERLADAVKQYGLGAGRRIYIDGFTDFTGQELEVIRAFLRSGAEVTVCLGCDEKLEGEMFAPSIKTVLFLRRMAEELGLPVNEIFLKGQAGLRAPALDFLERNMFSFSSEKCEEGEGQISLFRAESVSDECELAAARAVWLAREQGARWRDIAVAVRGYEDYRQALESAFEKYGVPLYSSRRSDVLQRPLPAMIVSAFETIHGGWAYDDIFTYLKTGLCGISAEECDKLSGYAYLWSLRGGAWTSDSDWSLHPDGYGKEHTDESRERLEEINRLRRKAATPLKNLYERGKTAETALEQLQALADFFEELNLAENLEKRAEELRALGRDALAAEYVQLWDITVSAMEQCAGVLGDMRLDQEGFARLFRLMLSRYDLGTIPVSLDCVTAGDMDRMRRRRIKHLLVLGASDERLPAQSDSPGIFTDDERERLSELGLDISSGGSDIYREFSLIYNCLTLPSDSLVMSYPMHSAEGSELGPSFVFSSTARMFDLDAALLDTDRLRTNAPLPALELAVSGHGGLRTAAEEYFAQNGDSERLSAIRRAAVLRRGALSDESVRSLYGKKLHLSASRAELFASCKFEYFMKYGLKAKPRQPAGFDPPQFGSFMHYVLENVAREVSRLGGFKEVSGEKVEELAEKYVNAYISEKLDDFAGRSQRFIYLFKRLTATVKRVAGDMAEELRRSDFVPLDFELDFSEKGDMPPIEIGENGDPVFLTGIADRVDGWIHNGKLYLRIVDYKTGRKSFSLSDVCSGMGLQMLLYLFALSGTGEARYGREIVPAGVLYAPARDANVPSAVRLSDEELEKERRKTLRRSGLILDEAEVIAAMENSDSPEYIPVRFNKDGRAAGSALAAAEQLGALSRFVSKTLTELAGQLRSGMISADPYYRNAQDNACLYCDYAGFCGFGDCEGEQVRQTPKLREPEAWDYIESRAGEESDGNG